MILIEFDCVLHDWRRFLEKGKRTYPSAEVVSKHLHILGLTLLVGAVHDLSWLGDADGQFPRFVAAEA